MRLVDRVGGVLVDTYRIERLIAEGSMGSVYEARHLRVPKRFAVKFLRVGLEENAEALQRFRREAEVVATLDHPNIVALFDYNVGDDGVPYIVLEFLDGEHLAARLRRDGKLPLPEVVRIVGAVAGALTAAHAREVIHRDLKPENIVLLAGGAVKVVDFGVAKLRGAPELTALNTIVGTVPYMAPEQLLGGVLDARVDQYALAAIAYEMLAGEMAFSGTGSVADVARRVLTHQPPFIADVPQAVNEVLFRGMARAAGERFGAVAELAAALGDAAVLAAPSLGDTAAGPELPPLSGEATRVTWAAGVFSPNATAREDDQAPLAATPADGAVASHEVEPRTPTVPSPSPILGGPTAEMAALTSADERTDEQPALPPLSTLRVARPEASSPGRGALAEPRITLKTMTAHAATDRWNSVGADATQSTRLPARLIWIFIGLALGLATAFIAVWLLHR